MFVKRSRAYQWKAARVGINDKDPRICDSCGKTMAANLFALNGNGYYEHICLECKLTNARKHYAEGRETNSEAYLKKRFATLKVNAQKRKLPFNLTIEDLKQVRIKSRGLCWYTGLPLIHPSIDRIDNSRGYEPDNIIECERHVNAFRKDMPVEEFLKLCQVIAAHHSH